ncbi:Tyrosine-protein kinase [Parasponia andersonii]|uniref:Tyrosine-protein kinase n=1 Tax=Parasponia andersonii TaxID=3476 RepID=A0A2P5C6R4_PARAD|nr:Tyrosine-protein kinase [Parasponia andersonii]
MGYAKFISFIRKRNIRANKSGTGTSSVPNRPLSEVVSLHPSLQTSMSDIIGATENFSSDFVVGDSRLGLIYKAELSNGLRLAVMKFSPNAFPSFMEFRSELEILSKLRHRNIARILGYCLSGADKILIYEFHEQGILGVRLHGDMSPLPWETRHKIITGVAKGLAYIHDLDKPIIHRDLNANNVWLDSKLEAKISDFGVAKMIDGERSHVTTEATNGTDGYMPPEYEYGSMRATVKGDVYSFGVLMLEVATGKRPENSVPLFNGESVRFVEWAGSMVTQKREMEMLDPNVWFCASTGESEATNIKEYFRIAFMCADVNPRKRPVMRDVVELLTQNFA